MLAMLLYGLLPFTTLQALKFNHNSIPISLWPLTVWAFMASLRRPTWARVILFGVAAAAGVLANYYVLQLLATFIAPLWWPHRGQFYRSPAPYVAVGVFCALVAPHVSAAYIADTRRDWSSSVRIR